MILSAEKMKVFSYQILCREILTTGRILMFFNNHNGIARNDVEDAWRMKFATLEDLEALKEKLELMMVVAKNLKQEIVFASLR